MKIEKSSCEIEALADCCRAHAMAPPTYSATFAPTWWGLTPIATCGVGRGPVLGCYALRGMASREVSTRRISIMRSLARRSRAARRVDRSALLGRRTRALAWKSISPDIGALVRSVASSSTLAPLLASSCEISRTMPGRSSPTSSRSRVRPGVASPAPPLGSPTTLRPRASRSARAAWSAAALSLGTSMRRMPANLPARRAMRLSSQLPPCEATTAATASTRPGRSGPIRVRTKSVMAMASDAQVKGIVFLDGLAAGVGDELPDVAHLRLDDAALVDFLGVFFLVFVLVLEFLVLDGQFFFHFFQYLLQGIGGRPPEFAHRQRAFEFQRQVDVCGNGVGVEPVQELGHGFLAQAFGEGVRGVVVLGWQFCASLFQQTPERLHFFIVQAIRERGEFDCRHDQYGAAGRARRQRRERSFCSRSPSPLPFTQKQRGRPIRHLILDQVWMP